MDTTVPPYDIDALHIRFLVLAGLDPIVTLESWEINKVLTVPEGIHSSYLDSHPGPEDCIHQLRREAAWNIIAEYGKAKK